MNPRRLIERIRACDSSEEAYLALQAWLVTNRSLGKFETAHAVFAQARGGVDQEFLAMYSTRHLAQSFVDSQDEDLRQCLVIREVVLNAHPSDDYWAKPSPHVESELERLLAAAAALSGDPSRALAWLDLPLAEYGGLTPRELVEQGRSDVPFVHLAQLESGSSG